MSARVGAGLGPASMAPARLEPRLDGLAPPRVSRAPFRPAPAVAPVLLLALLVLSRFALLACAPHEWDEFLFTNALDDFDMAHHRPHPPGYPVFVLLARASRSLLGDGQLALAATGAAGGVLGALAVYALARQLLSRTAATYAAALFALNPVVWINSLRGLSDVPGVALSVAAIGLLLRGCAQGGVALAACGGAVGALAIGTRPVSLFVVLPVLALHGLERLRARDRLGPLVALWAFAHVCSLWLAGLVVDAGGVQELTAALSSQAQGFYRHDSLASRFSLEGWWAAWRHIWIDPWGLPWLGWALCAAALPGWVLLARRGPRAVVVGALLAFASYALFDSLFMATGRQRYHAYLVPLVAVGALAWDPWQAGGTRARWHVAPLAVLALLAAWVGPLAWLQHREAPPIVRAIGAVEQGWRRERTVLHVAPFFVAAAETRLSGWERMPGEQPRAPRDGRSLVLLGLEPDFYAEPPRRFRWDRRLLELVSMSVVPHVAERRVFPVRGVHPVESRGDERWVWTEREARFELVVPEPDMELVLTLRAPIDPLRHRLRVLLCGEERAVLPVTREPVLHRVPLPQRCGRAKGPLVVDLLSSLDFVPAELDPGSSDARRLAVRIDAIGVEPAGRGAQRTDR